VLLILRSQVRSLHGPSLRYRSERNADRLDVRRQLWRNFGSLLSATNVIDRMPRAILGALATAGYEG